MRNDTVKSVGLTERKIKKEREQGARQDALMLIHVGKRDRRNEKMNKRRFRWMIWAQWERTKGFQDITLCCPDFFSMRSY